MTICIGEVVVLRLLKQNRYDILKISQPVDLNQLGQELAEKIQGMFQRTGSIPIAVKFLQVVPIKRRALQVIYRFSQIRLELKENVFVHLQSIQSAVERCLDDSDLPPNVLIHLTYIRRYNHD